MAAVQLLGKTSVRAGQQHQQRALELAERFPGLCVKAREVASSVMHGVHGRRRAGAGETFWQFRPFVSGEAAGRIDWRRSAKDGRLYVREREWEAAHMVFLWIDRSPSMWFVSSLAMQPKIDRALVLGLAAAELLVRGGERAGLLGLTPALAVRDIIERLAAILLAQERTADYVPEELPAPVVLPRGAQAILIGDFLADPESIAARIESISAQAARGHLVMVADPVEETFPFTGNIEFAGVDSPDRLRVGQAETFRQEYIRRLATHRDAIKASARRRGWTLTVHRTDRPAAEALLALRTLLDATAGAMR
ncbi:MAG: DUF58 domain-containing protein [Beijerinckiaceae bacterium]|nr:DUF58 domain-containing protein [Beijerinckiaceae bacterium]